MLKLLPLFLATLVGAVAAPVDEIEALLHFVGGLQGATFIRNGSDYSPSAAEAHLRLKWSNQKKQVKTAEDFIRLCATKSSMSGDAYLIRFADGHEEPAAAVLTNRLAEVRRQHHGDSEKPAQPAVPTVPGDLHPAADITIVASDDGLERFIRIYVENVGDPWKFTCEASSIPRLLEFLSQDFDNRKAEVVGVKHLSSKTYRIDFNSRTWTDKAKLLADVVAALETAFQIKITFVRGAEKTIIRIDPVPASQT